MTVHRDKFLVNKTNRCIEFQFLLVLRLYMFRAALLPIIRISQPYIGVGKFYVDLMTICYQEQDGNAVPSCSW